MAQQLRRLDHIGVLVANTTEARRYFEDRLGLPFVHSEVLASPHVRLTYLDGGNAFIQLVEPLDDESELAGVLRDRGEGVHHLCFGVRTVESAVEELSDGATPQRPLTEGRGRVSGFLAGDGRHGVRIELTEFHFEDDVIGMPGWLPDHLPPKPTAEDERSEQAFGGAAATHAERTRGE
jgi:methylmalonyl-CoA/ethylmalonyl-CoA epimerase